MLCADLSCHSVQSLVDCQLMGIVTLIPHCREAVHVSQHACHVWSVLHCDQALAQTLCHMTAGNSCHVYYVLSSLPHDQASLTQVPCYGCRQVTTGSGELPAHIGHGLEADDRFGRGSARKTDASRYAVKADSGSGRSMHASPARLIITSGAPGPPNRDMALARAASGDLSRADSGSLRAPRSPSISVITAPHAMQQTAEGPVQRHRLASPQQAVATAAASGHHPGEQPATVRNDATQLSGRGDSDSHRERQVTGQEGSLPTAMTPQQQLVNAQAAGQVPGSPFPPRVDSLSHWARHVDAQQRSSSPQVNGFAAT